MPPQDKPAGSSPFEIITPGKSKKIGKTGIIVGVSIVIFLILSVVAGILLVRQNQNVQEKAVAPAQFCPDAGACPFFNASHGDNGTLLRDCYPAESDNTPKDSTCSTAGRVLPCGPAHTQYCCPVAGGVWTADMTICNSLAATATPTIAPITPTATPTAIPTLTPTPTGAAATATPTPTPTGTSSSAGNACNGTCGSNSNCQTGLYCYSGFCRNPLCASDSSCGCTSATGSPTPAPTATAPPAGGRTTQTTPLPIPVTGTNWPTIAGIGVGIITIIASLLLAL